MADNLLLPVTLDRVLDSNGDPVSGAKVHVYNAGTSDAVTNGVWTDIGLTSAGANPMVADSGGYLAARYVGTGSYKLLITTSADVTIKTEDNLPGALDTSSFSNDTATPTTPVITKSSNYTIQTTDRAKIVSTDPTSGDVTISLLSAVTAGDNFRITIKHVGTANSVQIATTGGQTVDGASSFTLSEQYEAITATSDGANWHITDDGRLNIAGPIPRGHYGGVQVTLGAEATHDVVIGVGATRDTSDSSNLTITSALTKQIDASWAAGSAAGGMANGVSLDTNTWYHYFLVDLDAGGTDAGYDTSVTAANLLATSGVGTVYQIVHSVLTDGSSNIIPFTRLGDEVLFDVPINEYDTANPGTSAVTHTITTPLGRKTWAICSVGIQDTSPDTSAGYGIITSPDQTDTTPSSTLHNFSYPGSGGEFNASVSLGRGVRTDTSSQIRTRISKSDAAITQKITLFGYIDPLGRFD